MVNDGKPTIDAHDPPGFLDEFVDAPVAQRRFRSEWSNAVAAWIAGSIASQERNDLRGQPCQFVDELNHSPTTGWLRQEIVWNAFPGTLRRRWGRRRALVIADHVLPLNQRMDNSEPYFEGTQWARHYYRPQDEYCEWRVSRGVDGVIERVTFTSEPPEYWQALHGDTIPGDELGKAAVSFTGDEERLVQLYRQYVDPTVELRDLEARVGLLEGGKTAVGKGGYNPWNRWNTVDGIMHLSHPSNTLQAEIQLGADATVLYSLGGQDDPRLVADSDALIARARLGGNNRCSDPTISGSVNHLAALGCALTLANPIGLYMDHIDFAGWSTPKGDEVDPEWFRIVRGQPGLIERAVFEVPHHLGFRVGDLSIGGEAIEYGGQIAERITVKLVALADPEGGFATKPRGLPARASAPSDNRWMVASRLNAQHLPTGSVAMFDYAEALSAAREFDDLLEAPPAAEPLPRSGRAL